MGYIQVRYDSRYVIYDHRGFIRLASGYSTSVGETIEVLSPIVVTGSKWSKGISS